MIFIDKIKSVFTRSTSSNPSKWLVDWISGGTGSSSGVKVNEESALKFVPFWAAVRVISGTLSSLPFQVYKRNPEGGKEKIVNHRVYDLLHNRPNPYMDAITLIETRMAHVLTYGNGYAEIQRDGAGRPVALWPLLPDRTARKVDSSGVPYYEVMLGDGSTVDIPDYNVLHIKGLGFDGYTGYNVVDYNKEAIGYGVAVKEYGSRFFGQDANPGGVLEYPNALSDNALKHLQESWTSRHSGLSNKHRIQVLEEGAKWSPIGVNPDKAQALEVQRFSVDDISRIFNIPPHKLGSMDRATFCLPADVEVYTEGGNKSISDIKTGELVWSLNEDKKWELSPVLRSECTGEDEILNIRTTNRSFRANARHRVLVRRKYPVTKKANGSRQRVEWKDEYVQAGDLQVGDTIVTAKELPSGGVNIVDGRELTKEFMEICGLILGDGNVYDGSVSIARANNARYMDYYRCAIKETFVSYSTGLGENVGTVTTLRPVHVQEGDRQTRFSSVLAARELKKLGLSGTARTKRVPGWVFTASKDMRLSFVRGFLDADGSVDKKGRMSFSSCNEFMLSQIRHLCIGCGIPVTNLRCQEGIATLPNKELIAYKQYCFTCSDPGSNKNIGTNDPKYVDRIAKGKPFSKKDRKYPWFGGKGFDIEGCSLARISSIEIDPVEKVYDLEVANTHSFIANGVVVHNSNIEEQNIDFIQSTMLYWFRKWESEVNYKLFMPSEQKTAFAEILVDAMLRGNIKDRYAAYAVARQWGFLSVNDIRGKENMNPLGPEGDIYLQPMNMVPAGTEPEDGSDNDSTDEETPDAESEFKNMLKEQFNRVVTKQKGKKYDVKQREWAYKIMISSVRALVAVLPSDNVTAHEALSKTLVKYLNDERKINESDAESFADELISLIGGSV